MAIGRLARRQDQRGAAVDDPARVAGGHGAVLLERRRQLRQALHRRLGPHVIVAIHELDALAPLISTGTISSAKRPARHAASASCWLRRAYASCASRVMPYFAAQFSAVIAIVQPQ